MRQNYNKEGVTCFVIIILLAIVIGFGNAFFQNKVNVDVVDTLTALPTNTVISSNTPFPTQTPQPTLTPTMLPVRLDLVGNSLQYVESKMEEQGYSFDNNEIIAGNGVAIGVYKYSDVVKISLEERQYNLVSATWSVLYIDPRELETIPNASGLLKAIFGDQVYQEKILPFASSSSSPNPICFDGYIISSGNNPLFYNPSAGVVSPWVTIWLGVCN